MIDANDVYAPLARHIPTHQGALWAPTLYWSLPTPRPDFTTLLPAGPGTGLSVYANHGRWVLSCPTCNGSQLACPTDPRFICCDCGNIEVEGRWRQVLWPSNHGEVAALLDRRPIPNRNWLPHESLSDLREQNLRHGLDFESPTTEKPEKWTPPKSPFHEQFLNQATETDEASSVTPSTTVT